MPSEDRQIEFTENAVRQYLENAITYWQAVAMHESSDESKIQMANYSINAFQDIMYVLFGEGVKLSDPYLDLDENDVLHNEIYDITTLIKRLLKSSIKHMETPEFLDLLSDHGVILVDSELWADLANHVIPDLGRLVSLMRRKQAGENVVEELNETLTSVIHQLQNDDVFGS